MVQLRVTSPQLHGAVFVLHGDFFTIGRDPDNHIQLHHSSVSKHHALIKAEGDEFQLFDLHSTNGVIVNGRRCVVAHLRDGDRVLLGEIELRVENNHPLASAQAAPAFPAAFSQPIAPAPNSAPSAAKSNPAPASAPEAATATTTRARKLLWFSRFRRAKPPGCPADNPPAPPSREQIRSELARTFAKMGLEMPKPPPRPRR